MTPLTETLVDIAIVWALGSLAMAWAGFFMPHDVGRWLAQVRNSYDLWRDKK